jgi:hypothetical protein
MAMIAVSLLVIAGVITFGVWLFRWQYRRADSKLRDWVRRCNYELLDKRDASPLGTGPKARSASNKQVVYQVTISDENGIRRSALIKIGSPTLGMLSDDLIVEWQNGNA